MTYDFMFSRALELHQDGRFAEAEQLYRQILETAPKNPDILNLLGLVAQARGVHNEAVTLFYKAIKISPDHAPYRFNLALSLAELGKPHEAIEAYQKMLALTPDVKEAWYNLGQLHKTLGNFQTAASCFHKAAALDKTYAEPLVGLALLSDAPEKDLNALLFLFPDCAEAHYQLSVICLEQNRYKEALAHARSALELAPESTDACLAAAFSCLKLKDDASARDYFAKTYAINPKSVPALAGLAAIASREREFDKAEALFVKALELAPNNTEALINYADMLYQTGRLLEAVETSRKAVLLAPDNPAVSNNLGIICKDLKDFDEALGLFFNAYKKSPQTEEFSVNIYETLLLLHREKPQEAEQIAANWLKDSPENIFAQHLSAAFNGQSDNNGDSQFSQKLFDNFALSYEQTLKKLNYRLPEIIKECIGTPRGLVWDLGCGTGLIAEQLKSEEISFIGVDISAAMLDIARSKNLYKELINSDIFDFLNNPPAPPPALIIAADVFCYMGSLEGVISRCAPCPLCFSVEKSEKDGFSITTDGRYKHNKDYVNNLLTKSGYAEITIKEAVIRLEDGKPVAGFVFMAR